MVEKHFKVAVENSELLLPHGIEIGLFPLN